MDAIFYAMGIGDPFRFFAGTGPPMQAILTAVTFASLIVPVLGVAACFAIERAQVETHRRLRASAL